MGLNRPIDITAEQRKTVLALLASHLPNTTAWVYGSRVKWTSGPKSDLDMVVFAGPEQSGRVSGLREAFEESNLPFRVDLFVWDDVPEQFRKQIEAEHVVLVEKEELGVASGWRRSILDQLGRIVTGKTPPSKIQGSFGGDIPFVTPTDLDGRRVIVSTGRSLTRRGIEAVYNSRIPARSIMVSCIGSDMGKTAIAARECVTNQQINSIVVDSRDEPLFVYYNLSNRKAEIRASAGGSAQPILNKSGFGQFDILLPPLPEQRAIAHILGTLDDKIELNRRMNQTLEEMSRALFKSWFVDFDPVRAKATLKHHASPPQGRSDWSVERARAYLDRMDADIAALFPDSFVDSELGPIPEGWEVKALGECAAQRRRGVSPEQIDAGTPYIALEHMPKRCIALPQWGTAGGLASSKFRFEQRDILFGKLRPYFHKVGVAPIAGVCSTDIVVISPVSDEWFGFVLGHASSSEFVHYTDATSTGTKMPRTNWTDMSRYQVALPSQKLADFFSKSIQPAIDRIVSSIHESRSLTAVRETLLPKIISGELRVGVGDDFVGDIVTSPNSPPK